MSPTRFHAGPHSAQSPTSARTRSKSFTSTPFATKRGFQCDAASWTRFGVSTADTRASADLLVLATPGVETAALVVVLERIRLRVRELAVELRAAIVRLPGTTPQHIALRYRRGEQLLVVVARAHRLEPRQVEVGNGDAGVVSLCQHPLRRRDAGATGCSCEEEVLRDDDVDEVFRGAGARHRAPGLGQAGARPAVHAAA